jgi:hypothetical protein
MTDLSSLVYVLFYSWSIYQCFQLLRVCSDRMTRESFGSRERAVGIVTDNGLDNRGFEVRVGSGIFSSPRRPDRFWGPPSLQSNGYRGVKRLGGEADHSPPTSAEAKKTWIYTSTPPISLHGVVLN